MTSHGDVSRRAFLPASAAVIGAAAFAGSSAGQQLTDQSGGFVLAPGIHRVATNTVIKGDLMLQPGATIEVAAGRTLTVLGGLVAPIAAIFPGPGTTDLNRSRIACAHPEWWGAVTGVGDHDCLPALKACLRAHPTMQLLATDYYMSDTFVVDRPFCRIIGSGFRGTELGQGTRLIVNSGTADVMRAGAAAAPSEVNRFLQNVTIGSLALCRSLPVDAAGGQLPAGLRAQYLLFSDFQHLSAFEHGIGFVALGLVRSSFTDCVAFRSLPGKRPQQPYRGFFLDGLRDIGLAGGNASLFLSACNATIGGNPAVADAVGLLLEGAFADTFVTDFETAGLATGIRVDGKTAAIGRRARNGHINLHVHLPIIDQCTAVGIDIFDTAPQALIDLVDPYVAVAPGARAAIRFQHMRGSASITGGQLAGTTDTDAHGTATGLAATASRQLQVTGLKILEHAQPVVLAECSGFSLQLAITNADTRPGGSGVMLRDCDRGTAAVLLSGEQRAFASGVQLEGRATSLRIDAIGIDAATVGGATNRVRMADGPLTIPSRTMNLIVEGV